MFKDFLTSPSNKPGLATDEANEPVLIYLRNVSFKKSFSLFVDAKICVEFYNFAPFAKTFTLNGMLKYRSKEVDKRKSNSDIEWTDYEKRHLICSSNACISTPTPRKTLTSGE